MAPIKNIASAVSQPSYEAEMSALRANLAGRPYDKEVKDILPDLTKDHIRNVVNGKCSNPLVLAALKIVVYNLDSNEQRTQQKLSELAGRLEQLGVAA
jgi:hypothetical protein